MTRPPSSTYRLQLHPGFDFDAAAAVLPYLADLGVSHVYLSPSLQAAPGSMHGYDVVDPTRPNAELGGAAGFDRLSTAATAAGLGVVLDIVPNHMDVSGPENRWWWDVLAEGRGSAWASYFDIDWDSSDSADSADPQLQGKVLIPILGDPLPDVLARGELTVDRTPEHPELRYFDHRLPLRSGSLDDHPDSIESLVEAQHYRLAHWRTAATDLNYRRFFDVTTLAGVRVEDPEVFAATHSQVLDWIADGKVHGLRIDHPDGLRDPAGYFSTLAEATGGIWTVVEKILEDGERLPIAWPVAGTTGYDRLATINRLFVDAGNEPATTSAYGELTGEETDLDRVVIDAKDLVLDQILVAELRKLTALISAALTARGEAIGGAGEDIGAAIRELLIGFGVYRSYVRPESGAVSATDIEHVQAAAAHALERRGDLAEPIERIADILLLRGGNPSATEHDFVRRFQQLTGPTMAKGLEDTTFYRFTRLLSLNEVGSDPGSFGGSIEDFHAENGFVQTTWPDTMVTLSTHDTKRSADVRARISVLSELPEQWATACAAWMRDSAKHWVGAPVHRHTQHLLFQTLIGAWPIPADRVSAYLAKATKEAKLVTSWIDADPDYDAARDALVAGVLSDTGLCASIEDFVASIEVAARRNSLAQALLALTLPGIPDTYQGSELWDRSLVDPDNRRPVDFDLRQTLLTTVRESVPTGWADDTAGIAKLRIVTEALHLRTRRPDCFGAGSSGAYRPLTVTGERAVHAVGFRRGEDIAVVVPRLTQELADWGDTAVELPAGAWQNLVSGVELPGGTHRLAAIFEHVPIALLERRAE